jgi:predicted DCC family thiol-disulfide oxidoreductase YuxK
LGPAHTIAASQDFDDSQLAAMGLTRHEVDSAAWWVEPPAPPAGGAEAISRALVAMGGLEAVIGRLVWLPGLRVASKAVYQWVADNRPTVSRWAAWITRR